MKIENFIALRYIKESKKNKNISTASIIVIAVIAVAIIFFISSVSIMNGYIYGIMKIAFEVKTFHVDYPIFYSYEDSKYILDELLESDEIAYADIYREIKCLLSAKGKSTGQIYFRSVPEDVFEKDHGLDQCIKLLKGKKSLKLNEIFISKKTAEKLGLKVGDSLYLTAMITSKDSKLTLKRLKVSGIFTTGYVELDEQLSYISNSTGDKIFGQDVRYNIFIKLKDYKKANEFAISHSLYGFNGMLTWEETNYNELTALKFQKNVIAFIVILVVFVAALNILTTIYITVFEKNQDIGILKAIGYSPRQINIVFILNGIYLGFIGVVIGISTGILIMRWLNEILQLFTHIINFFRTIIYKIVSVFIELDPPVNFEIFSKDFYLDKIYTDISFFEIILIASLALVFSILAALIPAIKAGNIKPIEVIKNG